MNMLNIKTKLKEITMLILMTMIVHAPDPEIQPSAASGSDGCTKSEVMSPVPAECDEFNKEYGDFCLVGAGEPRYYDEFGQILPHKMIIELEKIEKDIENDNGKLLMLEKEFPLEFDKISKDRVYPHSGLYHIYQMETCNESIFRMIDLMISEQKSYRLTQRANVRDKNVMIVFEAIKLQYKTYKYMREFISNMSVWKEMDDSFDYKSYFLNYLLRDNSFSHINP